MGSELRISSALSISEIVNKPENFVASHPYFVVDKTEWIQCRYLLVQIDPTEDALSNPLFAPSGLECTGYIKQDPERLIRVQENAQSLQIPLNALSISRQQESLGETSRTTAWGPIVAMKNDMNDESCYSDSGDDPDILVGDILKPYGATKGRKRQRRMSLEQASCSQASSPSPRRSPKKSGIGGKKKNLLPGTRLCPPLVTQDLNRVHWTIRPFLISQLPAGQQHHPWRCRP